MFDLSINHKCYKYLALSILDYNKIVMIEFTLRDTFIKTIFTRQDKLQTLIKYEILKKF